MGINYSKVMCVEPNRNCVTQAPIPYPIYAKNIKGKNKDQIHNYVCGNSKQGSIFQCCDPFDPASQEIVQDSNLIRIIRDNDGQYKEFQVCTCTDKKCEEQYCKDFKKPTQYEKCRARTVKKEDQVPVSANVYKILAANTYTNCYEQCKI
jgi:hypothetical protein